MSDPADHHLGEDLTAMADGGDALTPARRSYLAEHVADCPACRNALATATLILSTIDEAPPAEPSKSFDRALFARLDALDRKERPTLFDHVRELLTLPRLAAVAALAVAMVLALVLGVRRPSGSDVPSEKAMTWVTPDVAQNLDGLAVAEDLELLRDYEVFEDLEVLEELDAIENVELGGAG